MQVATILSKALGREITFRSLDANGLREHLIGHGVPAQAADILVALDVANAKGASAWLSDDVEQVLGRPPINFKDFVEKNKGSDAWKPVAKT